jgi:hypothetical protein
VTPLGLRGLVHGYEIDSDLPLARLRRATGSGGRGSLMLRHCPHAPAPKDGKLLQVTRDPGDGSAVLSVRRLGGELNVWCEAAGTASIDALTGVIGCRPGPDLDAWEDRVVNLFVPVLLADRGELVVHGSAVSSSDGAIVVCGPSGRGKSTLAAVLGLAGGSVLAEDAVALTLGAGGPLVWPGPVGVRLDPVTARALDVPVARPARGKLLCAEPQRANQSEPAALAAIVLLEPRGGSAMTIRRLRATEAVAQAFPNVFRLDRASWQAAFDRTARLTGATACYTVRLPDDLTGLARHAEDLLAAITASPVRSAV